jgi:hypothetical protein
MSVLTTEPDAVPAGEEPPDIGERHRLTAVTGLAAAGAHGLGFTLPVTLAIRVGPRGAVGPAVLRTPQSRAAHRRVRP